jgi:hypothetical protein
MLRDGIILAIYNDGNRSRKSDHSKYRPNTAIGGEDQENLKARQDTILGLF